MRPTRSLSALAVLLTLAACGLDGEAAPSTGGAEAPASEEAGDSEEATGLVTAVTSLGEEITLDAPAERVVCLDGTCIDALAELELPPATSIQIDQVRHEHFFGPDVETEPLDGTFFEPSLEGIVAAEPDLVIGAAGVHGHLAEALGDIPFLGVALGEEYDNRENLRAIAELTGRQEQAEAALDRHSETLEAYGPGEREIEVLSMYGGATDDIGIDAADSSIGRTISAYTAYPWPEAGEGDSGFLEIGLEDIVGVDPEHIFVLDFGFDPGAPDLVDQLVTEPVWSTLRAVEAGNVHVVDNRWWGTTGGTRGQQLILDVVLPTVYPEEFPEPLGLGGS